MLSALLEDYQAIRCSDARDKVYAMLALASDRDSPRPLVADYHKTASQLYCEVLNFRTDVRTEDMLHLVVFCKRLSRSHLEI